MKVDITLKEFLFEILWISNKKYKNIKSTKDVINLITNLELFSVNFFDTKELNYLAKRKLQNYDSVKKFFLEILKSKKQIDKKTIEQNTFLLIFKILSFKNFLWSRNLINNLINYLINEIKNKKKYLWILKNNLNKEE